MNFSASGMHLIEKRMSYAYIFTRILDTPFWALFNLIPFILYKDLHGTPFQIAILVTLKPLVSIFSSYWTHSVSLQSKPFMHYLIKARFYAFFPFLFFPFFSDPWYVIFSFALFMFLQVGMMPLWMELLKQHLPSHKRDKIFSYTQAFGYLGGGLLPFFLGWILDYQPYAWKIAFPTAALLALLSYPFQRKINFPSAVMKSEQNLTVHPLLGPWKSVWEVLKKRPDFTRFQIGWMFIGGGLMIMQPALPLFFLDHLHLSYTELAVAITLCKGIGFAVGSPLWIKGIRQMNLFYLGAVISCCAAGFIFLLAYAETNQIFLYIGYFVYGITQAGSELSWNLSGTIFAQQEDSTPYSTANIIAVGIRGGFIPILGALLLSQFGSLFLIYLSGIICLISTCLMTVYGRLKNHRLLQNSEYSISQN